MYFIFIYLILNINYKNINIKIFYQFLNDLYLIYKDFLIY